MQNSNIEKTMASYELDKLDEKILKLIIGDARKPFLEVARVCNVSGAAIHQRVQKLIHTGVIRGSEFMLDYRMVGYKTCAYMGLFLQEPGQFTSIVEALKDIPEVVECYLRQVSTIFLLKSMREITNICLRLFMTDSNRSD